MIVGVRDAVALQEQAARPLPSGDLLPDVVPPVVVGTPAAHPADVVQVVLRSAGELPRVLRAHREPGTILDPTCWFRTHLPALSPGREADYRVEWLRAGRRMATLPADGSWYHLVGAPDPAVSPRPEEAWPSRPRFRPGLEFFAALTVDLRAEPIGPTPEGYRINFYVADGRVRGPNIDAVVVPEGGDWMCIRPDGIGAVNIKITYRTSDGALILEQAGGIFDTGPDGYAQVAAGSLGGAPPFYATPTWSTSDPRWIWLTRRQGFGFGRVVMDRLQVQCDLYLPDVSPEGTDR